MTSSFDRTRVLLATCLVGGLAAIQLGCGSGGEDGSSSGSSRVKRGFIGDVIEDKRIETEMGITTASYGTTADGAEITEYTCVNAHGMEMKMITYGATMTSLKTCDKEGNYENVTLGYDSLAEYENGSAYFGATVGRYCNRIAAGKFTIDGQEYELAVNNEPNHLHGGLRGFDKVVWNAEPIEDDDRVGVKFTYQSPDGEEGYPGTVDVIATYTINNEDTLQITLEATTDKATHVNLTNHNYWNLGGAGSGPILDHEISIACPLYLEVDDSLIPTGTIELVDNTPLDFRTTRTIGSKIEEVKIGDNPAGYDHCYEMKATQFPATVAQVHDPKTGRSMDVSTQMRGLQFYTGNFLDGSAGTGGFGQYEGFCLETQNFPDSPNQSGKKGFTNTLLLPGRRFVNDTTYRFSVR